MSLTQNTLKLALPLAISLALAACGGSSSSDGSSGKATFGDNSSTDTTSTDTTATTNPIDPTIDDDVSTPPAVAKLLVYANTTLLDSDSDISDGSTDPAIIYMMAKDSDNIALSDVTFSPSVSAGATLFSGDVSDDGTLTTWKLVPEEPKNQTVVVSVTAGGITETLDIDIVGTTLEIDGANSISMDAPTTYTIKLKDAGGKGLSQQEVSVTSSLLTATVVTDAQGEAQFEVQPTVGGNYTLSVEALGATNSKTITVSSNSFNLNSGDSDTEVDVGVPKTVTLEWTADGVPQSGKVIYLSATRGQILSEGTTTEVEQVTTLADGTATFEILSSTAGGTVITASDNTTFLSTNLALEFISTTPKYLNIQADPSIIAPLGTSSILAQVYDFNDNPVKNQVVVFNLNDTVDGKLSSSKATTNSAGEASVVYTAGNATSALNGVVITSHLEGVAKTPAEATSTSAPVVPEDTTNITVGGEAVRIAFGFDELITESAPFYQKTFGVIVTDNAGNPVANQKIDFTVSPTSYSKGELEWSDLASQWVKLAPIYTCVSEDVDKDGKLDIDEDLNLNRQFDEGEDLNNNGLFDVNEDLNGNGILDAGEDINLNGVLDRTYDIDYNNSGTLEPTNSTAVSNNSITDDSGTATATITYLQNYAWWENITLTATVTVDGTEYKAKINKQLSPIAADVTAETNPPNQVSPYGTRACEFNDIQLNGATN